MDLVQSGRNPHSIDRLLVVVVVVVVGGGREATVATVNCSNSESAAVVEVMGRGWLWSLLCGPWLVYRLTDVTWGFLELAAKSSVHDPHKLIRTSPVVGY